MPRRRGGWQARIDLGWVDGKRVQKSYYAATKAGAEEKLAEALRGRKLGIPPPTNITVGQHLAEWLPRQELRVSTRRGYEAAIRVHLVPHLGRIPLRDLTVADLDRAMRAWAVEGLAPYSILHLRSILSSALSDAQRNDLTASPSTAPDITCHVRRADRFRFAKDLRQAPVRVLAGSIPGTSPSVVAIVVDR